MRSDIMFERQDRPEIDENEQKGLEFLSQAEQAERSGDCKLAVQYYQKAFKLCPSLQGRV